MRLSGPYARRLLGVLACATLLPLTVATTPAQGRPSQPTSRLEQPPPGAARLTGPLPDAVAAAQIEANPPRCEGDGVAGARVEILYVYNNAKPSRRDAYLLTLRAILASVDDVFNDSAARFGASRHVRFVTEAAGSSCEIAVREVGLAPSVIADLGGSRNAIAALGYDKPGRQYIMLGDPRVDPSDAHHCGATWGDNDDRPGAENRFNTGPYYARIDVDCWGANAVAHELGHQLGAVLAFAPHFSGGNHCSDEWDLMCYGSPMSYVCPELDADRLLDCGGDDYFHPNPVPGSALATHWNIADSAFLIRSATPDSTGLRTGGTYAVTNAATGHALDIVDAAVGQTAKLTARARTDQPSQRWTLDYGTGIRLLNDNSGLCAEAAFSGTAPGTETFQYGCHEGNASLWTPKALDNGRYALLNNRSGLALTAPAAYPAAATLRPFTDAADQQWTLNALTVPGPQADTTYQLRAYAHRDGSVDAVEVSNGSTADGAPLVRNPSGTGTAQQWKLTTAQGGHVKLVNVRSGRCARPRNSTAGAAVEQRACDAGTAQQWRPVRAEDGRYMLVNRATGFALRVGADAGSGLVAGPAVGDAKAARAMIFWLRPVT
ncbi:RICIN domain-containing protein [Longispora sp. NPDC051575]|uniref:RICIN domain-containing protein n=1 Tax=Longispora sp. NPDC051575 TaxID=3154943 RepID=UPI003424E709